MARRICSSGLRLATPQRYILAAPLLLSIARHQWAGTPLSSGSEAVVSSSALAGAFQDMVEWGYAMAPATSTSTYSWIRLTLKFALRSRVVTWRLSVFVVFQRRP
ncbi:hypothetical protein [Neopusillimonas aromaticivorans]|uniref:hypothetical protein n=1 Tax=Neopusillimonas aromaticivorans TaxID=2979868 RepID=UPI0025990439|nr:hypothetical protein [Neopusillimonas aromaticivorans]WJJ93865.1 hypothetical protein N7E01_01010 [Neopusillimonas aromaticivorans]